MRATTVVVGAGHAGLATSHCLAALGIDHVVIERGEVGHSWRTERWDSLRLLTPNWLTRLPGLAYDGDDPDGYMDMSGVVAFLERYARLEGAPVETRTTVESVTGGDGGYDVVTDRGAWRCRTVVVASGACNLAKVPPCAASLPGTIESVTAMEYTKPSDLPDGGVLVVGASATGVQIAGEIRLSGRPVTLAVGEHVGCRAGTGAGTSSGGWSARASTTSAGTRSTTSCGLAACRRRSSSATPLEAPWISMRSPAGGSGWWAAWRVFRTQGRTSPDRSGTRAPWRISSRDGCWRRSTNGSRRTVPTASRSHRTGPGPRGWRTRLSSLSISARGVSGRSSGRPATRPTTPGSTSRCSTTGAD